MAVAGHVSPTWQSVQKMKKPGRYVPGFFAYRHSFNA